MRGDVLERFEEARYINLTTFRKNGKPVPTPVWCAVVDGRLVVRTGSRTGKAKRIRANGKAEVAPSDARGRPLGDFVPARAHIIRDPELQRKAEAALAAKYGLQYRLVGLLNHLRRGPTGETIFLEVIPEPEAEEARDGGAGSRTG